jgi:16S rRNA U516 pseudouridylate synthase RsuA-like enzyme
MTIHVRCVSSFDIRASPFSMLLAFHKPYGVISQFTPDGSPHRRKTLPCRAWLLDPQPALPPRTPPIRFRKNVPDVWIGLELVEGKNHQVRRMTAAVGHPTLRLLRVRIGALDLGGLPAGASRALGDAERAQVFAGGGVSKISGRHMRQPPK